jgi:uncharacterized protein YlzI (FlbEa/FlbD family)
MSFIELTLGDEYYVDETKEPILLNKHHISSLKSYPVNTFSSSSPTVLWSKITLNNGKKLIVTESYETIKTILEGKTDACK